VQQTANLPESVQQRLDSFLQQQRSLLEDLGTDFVPLIDEAAEFLQGGKRFRAQFLALGYRSIRPLNISSIIENSESSAVLDAASALELFHAAALVHDDIIDRSETRRGRLASHSQFRDLHRTSHFRGDSSHFGISAAILLGDLLQSWADESFQKGLNALTNREAARAARDLFNRMRTEVAVGQYLDVLEEQYEVFAEHQIQLERSTRVLIYKSAKYSVQAPLLIGAAMAGANDEQLRTLADFGLPVGVAFQLRDDVLGVFGNEAVTGKPTGDDLTEGKRTVLVTLAREALPPGPQRVFDDLHGTPDLDPEQIQMMQGTIHDTGARDRVERMISGNIGIARESLTDATLREDAITELLALAERAAQRDA